MSCIKCPHQIIQPGQGFQIFEVEFIVAHATNVTSEPFPWLILNRLRKTCLVLQCIGVVVCSAAFFHKRKFILKTVY